MLGGFVTKPTVGWYQKKGDSDKYREKDTYSAEFWEPLLQNAEFKEFVKSFYTVGYRSMIDGDVVDANEASGKLSKADLANMRDEGDEDDGEE